MIDVVNVTVTESVYDRLADLIIEADDNSIEALRIFVQGGGCSGFQYGFAFETDIKDDDSVLESSEGLKIVIDPMSLVYLEGAEIDYTKSLMGDQFVIRNPNAKSTCGCGSSFNA